MVCSWYLFQTKQIFNTGEDILLHSIQNMLRQKETQRSLYNVQKHELKKLSADDLGSDMKENELKWKMCV